MNKKKAFSLMEALICTALLTMLIAATAIILNVSTYSISDALDEFDKANGYDMFLDEYMDSVRCAERVEVTAGTKLYVETPTERHTFEFDHYRMIMDDEEMFIAKKGTFSFDGKSVTLNIQPENYGELEVQIFLDEAVRE